MAVKMIRLVRKIKITMLFAKLFSPRVARGGLPKSPSLSAGLGKPVYTVLTAMDESKIISLH